MSGLLAGDGAPLAVMIHKVHCNRLAEHQLRCELLGFLAECLTLFKTVNAMQPDALALPVVQHGDGISI